MAHVGNRKTDVSKPHIPERERGSVRPTDPPAFARNAASECQCLHRSTRMMWSTWSRCGLMALMWVAV